MYRIFLGVICGIFLFQEFHRYFPGFYPSWVLLCVLCLYSTKHIRGKIFLTQNKSIFHTLNITHELFLSGKRYFNFYNQVLVANNACIEYIPLMAAALVPVLMIMSIRNLEWLSPCSLLANLLLFFGFIMIWYYMFQELDPIGDVPAFATW